MTYRKSPEHQPTIGAGKRFAVVAGLAFTAACSAEIQASPTTEIFPTQPQATEIVPTPSSVDRIGDETAELVETTIKKTEVVANGLTYERRESGRLVDLFPGSEVFMADRGDAVVINEETGLRLVGQVVETEYGTLTLLISDRRYQHFYKDNFGETTALGGYPNMIENPYKGEFGRIISTLIQLKEKEIGFGVNLATHEPPPKNLVDINMSPGNAQRLADSMPEGFLDTQKIKAYSQIELGFPLFEAANGDFFLVRFTSNYGRLLTSYPRDSLHMALAVRIGEIWSSLLAEAGKPSDVLIRESRYAPLFSHPEINAATSAFSRDEPKITSQEELLDRIERAKFGVPEIIEVDFEKFK